MPRKRSKNSSEKKGVVVISRTVQEEMNGALIKSELGHHFASLFRPLPKRSFRDKRTVRWRWELKEEKQHPDTYLKYDEIEYEFRCFEELGEDDLKVFMRLVQVAGVGAVVLDPWMEEYQGADGKIIEQLSLFSSKKSPIENSRTMPVVRSEEPMSYNRFFGPLLKGRISKRDLEHFKKCLQRLASTTVFVEMKRDGKTVRSMGSNMVSFAIDHETGQFLVAVNPFVANAILGKPFGGYRPLIDGAIFRLKGTAAVVLSWLSAWLFPGKKGQISLDKLEEHIYADRAEEKERRKWRRRQLRKALEKIGELRGWEVSEIKKGVFEIERKSIKDFGHWRKRKTISFSGSG